MAEPIIIVEHLSKRYRISHQGQREQYATLRDVVAAGSKKLLKSFKSRNDNDPTAGATGASTEDFWALKDVSFEVQQGEVLGFIGRNGAGKSTLLKILSRITDPTEGRVTIRGRVASLLEVGTGFHQELTGRENIYLNGAILGMSRVEIKRKFDEIVDFAGVEKFLDTPVKRYSSGMYVRLAFAVAAHLEPEILIVDEVLAVGDADFQKKCLGKMQDVSTKEGRTVLFVSHNMNAVEALCQRIVHLEGGFLVADTSDVRGATAKYLSHGNDVSLTSAWRNPAEAFKNPWFSPSRFYLGDRSGDPIDAPIRNDQTAYIYVEGEVEEYEIALNVGYALYNDVGTLLYWSAQTDSPEAEWPKLTHGWNSLRSQVPMRLLNQGVYRLDLLLALYHRKWITTPGESAPSIYLSIQGGLSNSPYWMERRPGILAPVTQWTVRNHRDDQYSSPASEVRHVDH